MRFLRIGLMGLMGLVVSGCASQNAAIRHYELVTTTDARGNKSQKMMLADSLCADMPGLASLDVGRIKLKFNTDSYEVTEPVCDAKGAFLQTVVVKKLAGVYVSPVIAAQGKANKSFIDSVCAGISGAGSIFASMFVTGGLFHAAGL